MCSSDLRVGALVTEGCKLGVTPLELRAKGLDCRYQLSDRTECSFCQGEYLHGTRLLGAGDCAATDRVDGVAEGCDAESPPRRR